MSDILEVEEHLPRSFLPEHLRIRLKYQYPYCHVLLFLNTKVLEVEEKWR